MFYADWYHGEAFGLDAKKISMLIGFRCHICRKRSPPVCPYVRATRSLKSRVVKAQSVTAVDSCDRVTNAVSPANEMSLPQELLSHQDEQSSLPIDATHKEENLDATLDSNHDCVRESTLEGESGPLLSNGKEEVDSIQTCNQNMGPRPLTLSDPDHMLTENSVKSRNDDASALQDT